MIGLRSTTSIFFCNNKVDYVLTQSNRSKDLKESENDKIFFETFIDLKQFTSKQIGAEELISLKGLSLMALDQDYRN